MLNPGPCLLPNGERRALFFIIKLKAMKKMLLILPALSLAGALFAQKKNRSAAPTRGYAMTSAEKGGRAWKEIREIDAATGETLRMVYDSKTAPALLNARTGKPVAARPETETKVFTRTYTSAPSTVTEQRKITRLDDVLDQAHGQSRTHTRTILVRGTASGSIMNGASAAMAYDKKHERLYYTPMALNELRYTDLKSGQSYAFEGEAFGVVKGFTDPASQVTRMVIAADGNGYALTNDAHHLLRFSTGKKAEISDLGALTDAATNKISIHSRQVYGGDMIADKAGNLYVISAGRDVFKVSIKEQSAVYLGAIRGLPQGFSTNGAMVEAGSKVIIASAESTQGYYRFDLQTLQAEKISQSADVFNASDLANANLASVKKEDEKQQEEPTEAATVTAKASEVQEMDGSKGISVFPNPVTDGRVTLSFRKQPAGKYQVQLLDLSGRLIVSKEINVNSEAQMETFRFPELSVKGSYLLRVSHEAGQVNSSSKILVQ